MINMLMHQNCENVMTSLQKTSRSPMFSHERGLKLFFSNIFLNVTINLNSFIEKTRKGKLIRGYGGIEKYYQ